MKSTSTNWEMMGTSSKAEITKIFVFLKDSLDIKSIQMHHLQE